LTFKSAQNESRPAFSSISTAFSCRFAADFLPLQEATGRVPVLQTPSCHGPMEYKLAINRQIAQRKQGHQLRPVLGRLFVANLRESELALSTSHRKARALRDFLTVALNHLEPLCSKIMPTNTDRT
jgi:hypothetical protein